MKWLEVSIETTHDGIDKLSARLISLGIEGLQIEDFGDFTDFLENNRQYWDFVDDELYEKKRAATHVKIYLPDTPDGRDTLAMVRGELEGSYSITLGGIDEDDWAENWKQYYKPTPIGGRLLILPEWETLDTEQFANRAVFINNPGMAFGTGTHATTRLALEAVEREIRGGEHVLDIGCGSGILAICALLLGAQTAVGVDIDPLAADISRENAERNGVADKFRSFAGNVINDKSLTNRIISDGLYDIVFANIVADVIILLPEAVKAVLKPNGAFVASGIIDERISDTEAVLTAAGFEIIRRENSEGWNALYMKNNV